MTERGGYFYCGLICNILIARCSHGHVWVGRSCRSPIKEGHRIITILVTDICQESQGQEVGSFKISFNLNKLQIHLV